MVCAAGATVTTGLGLTFMITETGVPAQLLAVGVIVYVAVPDVIPVAVSVWEIVDPEPADAPDTPD